MKQLNERQRQRREYKTFSKSKRDQLEALYNAKVPVKEIANLLGYTQTSIYRELQRGYYMHTQTDLSEVRKYSADKAQRKAEYNMTAKGAPIKLGNDFAFANYVVKMIKKGYSPQSILYEIEKQNLKFQTKVCRVTLYSWIEKGIFNEISTKNLLRKGKRKTITKRKIGKKLPDPKHSIQYRPLEILLRKTFGHWEMDSVIGKKEKGETLLVLTERLTRMEIIIRSAGKSARDTVKALNSIERKIGSRAFTQIFKTITFDNGVEFSDTRNIEHSPYTKKKRTSVYYCHPFCSSERGSNENQNAFIRRFIKKGTPIEEVSSQKISEIQKFINTYPRHIFSGASSAELFQIELKKLHLENFFNFFHYTS